MHHTVYVQKRDLILYRNLSEDIMFYFLFYFSFSVLLIKFLNNKICSMNLEKNLKSNLFLLQGVKSEVDFSLWLQEITPFITLFEYK